MKSDKQGSELGALKKTMCIVHTYIVNEAQMRNYFFYKICLYIGMNLEKTKLLKKKFIIF